jgi:hypothetical protein
VCDRRVSGMFSGVLWLEIAWFGGTRRTWRFGCSEIFGITHMRPLDAETWYHTDGNYFFRFFLCAKHSNTSEHPMHSEGIGLLFGKEFKYPNWCGQT